jgi:hypothetical protein
MAWSISITAEGWSEIYEACHDLDKRQLINAITDDYFEALEKQGFDYNECNKRTLKLRYKLETYAAQECLADKAYELIEKNDTCDNGGYRYWIDREGYHAVYLTD